MCTTCNEYLAKKNTVGSPQPIKNEPTTSNPSFAERSEAINKAHAENMAANQELVMAIRQLTVAVNDRTRLLVKNMEAKP